MFQVASRSPDNQPHYSRSRHRGPLWGHLPYSRSSTPLRLPLSDTPFQSRPTRPQISDTKRRYIQTNSASPSRSSPRTTEFLLHSDNGRRSETHSARCCRGVTHLDLRSHCDQLGGPQGGPPLYPLDGRFCNRPRQWYLPPPGSLRTCSRSQGSREPRHRGSLLRSSLATT